MQLTAAILAAGESEGYGKTFASVEFGTPDHEMLLALRRNLYIFSAGKSYQQLRDLSDLLRDGKGNLRPWREFKAEASKLNLNYNQNWLKSEYQHAVASARMSGKWVRIQRDKEIFPMLRYSTVGDDRVRPEHKALDGIVRPVDDPFWDSYYPPNQWGCRCDVEQLAGGQATNLSERNLPVLPDMFKSNTGKDGVIFPPNHPYFEMSERKRKEVMRVAVRMMADELKMKVVYSGSRGKVSIHPMHGFKEAPGNIEIGKVLAGAGHDVELLPIFNEFKVPNPDARIDGVIFEFEHTSAKRSIIDRSIRRAKTAASRILLKFSEVPKTEALCDWLSIRLSRYSSEEIEEAWLIIDGRLIKLQWSDFSTPEAIRRKIEQG